MFQKFDYEVKNKEICIKEYVSAGTVVEIPERIEGYPVTEIAPYAFSGKPVEEVIFPQTIKKIGRYAFYNCMELHRLEFSNHLTDLGAGAFTGCHKVREMKVTFTGSKKSILREFLVDLPEEQMLELCFEDGTAKVLFPEYFEESIENTPARNLEVYTHGSGMLYRNCFVQKELDFNLYDNNFKLATGREFPETMFQLIFSRLLYPYHLMDKAAEKYKKFLKENLRKCAVWAAENSLEKEINYLADYCVETTEELDILIQAANRKHEIAMLSYLMDKKHQKFKTKRKSFEL